MSRPKKFKYLIIVLLIAVVENLSAATDTADYPAWMRDAVIYGIKPNTFVKNATYDDITRKLPELAQLGINTIWLQPVFKTGQGGQGYDVIDFFSLRDDLGTSAQLKKMVVAAASNGIRILFDFVPN
ncbi:MAG: hypothetical protein H0X41_04065, partial [Chitinophagaceae bacterium]|nr:hypothetical protein [Chitinophagaceae bacterium]